MYRIKNAYDIKETLKDNGGKWDADKKAWVISEEVYEKLNSRGATFGMRWMRGWGKIVAEKI